MSTVEANQRQSSKSELNVDMEVRSYFARPEVLPGSLPLVASSRRYISVLNE